MPATERIIFQPYVLRAQKRGAPRLEPGAAIPCRTAEEAQARADKVAMGNTSFAGAQVVRSMVDEEAGDYGEPELLASVGSVPEQRD